MTTSFNEFQLSAELLRAVNDVGYEAPSPIQAQTIPVLLEGHDILGQAQTGSGKTAAFALPLLHRLDLTQKHTQGLVLTPTRELAIQVAEAFQTYAKHLKGFHVLPIYGGQGYETQLRALRRGVHVVVGTPGRVMDHLRRGTLKLDQLSSLVLDEADEMLRMGFIDDVEWILEHTPKERQTALFSATLPTTIRKVANKHLNDPQEIRIQSKTNTADNIRQRHWQVGGTNKMDALTRILEMESFDAVIIFVRTKTATVEISEKLMARGYASNALNGDIPQQQRERTIDRLKKGQIDIVVATDVAARGLDVTRISHVINYDIPYDTEAYIHRIGRTARAGRSGDAILFVARREQHLLRSIERATKNKIEAMSLPSVGDINQARVERFKQSIVDTLAEVDLSFYESIILELQHDSEVEPMRIAAALAHLKQGDSPLLLKEQVRKERQGNADRDRERPDRRSRAERDRKPRDRDRKPRDRDQNADRDRKPRDRDQSADRDQKPRNKADRDQSADNERPKSRRSESGSRRNKDTDGVDMEEFRLEVGHQHQVNPSNIVGAIANEADIDSRYIGHITINEDYSTIELPAGMPKEIFQVLKKTMVCGQALNISKSSGDHGHKKGGGKDSVEKSAP